MEQTGGSKAMTRITRTYACLRFFAALLLLQGTMPRPSAQDEASRFRVNVVLVQLTIAVTDSKGNYVTGLKPEDFVVSEDNIQEKIANFEEGDEWTLRTPPPTQPASSPGADNASAPAPAPAPEPVPSEPTHVLAGTRIP